MKLYPNLAVTFTYQNFGTKWLGILRGSTEQIELTFNGLFNFGATNGILTYEDSAQTIATFWTTQKKLMRFWISRFLTHHGHSKTHAERHAQNQINVLRQYHETLRKYLTSFDLQAYHNGTISAERPDGDMKDAILSFAYAERD